MMFPTEKGTPSNQYRRSDIRYNRNTSRRTENRLPLSLRDKPRTRTNLLQISHTSKIDDLSTSNNISESLVISESSSDSPRNDLPLNPVPFSTPQPPKFNKLYSNQSSMMKPELEALHKEEEKENKTPKEKTTSLSKRGSSYNNLKIVQNFSNSNNHN